MFLLLFLVVLMIVTTVATSLYLYFSCFVPIIASYDKGSESCDMLSRKTDSVLVKGKITEKIPVYLFELNFLHNVLYKIMELSYVMCFFILVAEVSQKILYYLLVCFSQILSCFASCSFCKPYACFLFAKTFLQC